MENKKICQVCGEVLSVDDEITVCPICGAPHHKECYFSLGCCAKEEFHGTENQYDALQKAAEERSDSENPKNHLPKRIRCGSCGTVIDNPLVNSCPSCGRKFTKIVNPDGSDFHGNRDTQPEHNDPHLGGLPSMFDPLGGVPIDAITDGYSSEDFARFVAVNTQRYIPKFFALNKKAKNSWNWAAFLFPATWCFFRKMYQNGVICLLIKLISVLLLIPLYQFSYNTLGGIDPNGMTQQQLMGIVMENIGNLSIFAVLSYFGGLILSLITKIFLAIRGDWLYKSHCIENISKIKSNEYSDDEAKKLSFLKKGGVNVFLSLALLFVENNLLMILLNFIIV